MSIEDINMFSGQTGAEELLAAQAAADAAIANIVAPANPYAEYDRRHEDRAELAEARGSQTGAEQTGQTVAAAEAVLDATIRRASREIVQKTSAKVAAKASNRYNGRPDTSDDPRSEGGFELYPNTRDVSAQPTSEEREAARRWTELRKQNQK
jgi:hypothetical protein